MEQELKPHIDMVSTASMSPQIDKLATALSKAQAEFAEPVKDTENPHFKSKFASLASLRAASITALKNNGLSVSQLPRTPAEGVASVVTLLMHASGQWLSSDLRLKSRDGTAQPMGASISYARRYAYAAVLGLTAVEDDDGNHASVPDKAPAPVNTGYDRVSPLSGVTSGTYVISFGKFKDKTFDQISAKDIHGYIEYLKSTANREKKPLSVPAQNFIAEAEKHLAKTQGQKPQAGAVQYDLMPDYDDNDIPF